MERNSDGVTLCDFMKATNSPQRKFCRSSWACISETNRSPPPGKPYLLDVSPTLFFFAIVQVFTVFSFLSGNKRHGTVLIHFNVNLCFVGMMETLSANTMIFAIMTIISYLLENCLYVY